MKQIFTNIPIPELEELKKFIHLLAGFIAIIFGGLLAWSLGELIIWPWVVSLILVTLSFLNVVLLVPIYKAWIILGRTLGHIVAVVIMFFIFFFLVTPIGLIFRLTRRQESSSVKWLDSVNLVETDYERPY